MPITYETPAPLAAAASIYAQAAAARGRDDYGGGGGGGGGRGGYSYGAAVPYDTGIQDAISDRDRMQFQQQAQVQNNQRGYDMQRMEQEGAIAQQRERFELQAQLHETELSQQERMRLQRLKNSIGEITNDPTLTDQEKSDYIQQVKYNIDPLQRRLSQEKLAQEKIVKEALAEKRTAESAFEKQRLDVMGKSIEERQGWIPDLRALNEAAKDIEENVQFPPNMKPEEKSKLIAQMAREEVMKQGLGSAGIMQPDGSWEPIGGGGRSGSSASGGGGRGSDHPTGLSPQEYLKAVADATAQARAEASMEVGESGSRKPARPELNDAVIFNKRVGDILADVYGLPRNMKEYGEQQKSKGYQSKYKLQKEQAATAAGRLKPDEKQKPYDFSDPASQTPEQKADVKNFTTMKADIESANATREEREAALASYWEIKFLLIGAGSYGNLKADERQKFDEGMKAITEVTKKGRLDARPLQAPPGSGGGGSGGGGGSKPWWDIMGSGSAGLGTS